MEAREWVQAMGLQSQTTSLLIGFEYPLFGLVVALLGSLVMWLLGIRALRAFSRLASILPWTPVGRGLVVLFLFLLKMFIPVLGGIAAAAPYLLRVSYVEVNATSVESYASSLPVYFVVLVDSSKSMAVLDAGGSRMSVAKRLVESLFSRMTSKDLVVLAKFSSNVTIVCRGGPANCSSGLESIEPIERYSAIGDAVVFGESFARASGMPVVVIVVSDMANNYGSDPLRVLEAVKTPVVLLRVGSDPRGDWVDRVENPRVKAYSVVTGSFEELRELARKTVKEARLQAYQGRAVIPRSEKDYTPTIVALGILIALIAASLLATTPATPPERTIRVEER